MARGVIGAIADDDAVRNPLGGLSTGIGIGYRAKYDDDKRKPFPFNPTTFGVLRRIGLPNGELVAIDPLTLTSTRDIQFWKATAPVANLAQFPDNVALTNYSGDGLLTGEACWGVGDSGPNLAFDFTTGSLAPIVGSATPVFTRAGATATRINASGLIELVPANTPRFNYNPITLAAQGFLPETARSNEARRSEDFTDPLWAKTNITVTPNAVVAPDGTLTADILTATASTNTSITQDVVVGASGSYTYSLYVKQGSGPTDANRFLLRNATTATALNQIEFNFATGAINQLVGSGAIATPLKNGWWRLALPAGGVTAGNTVTMYVGFVGGPEVAGEALAAWGGQLENAAAASSYIPTAGAAVLRNADLLTYLLGPWFNAVAGTVYVQWEPQTPASAAILENVLSISDTANERFNLRRVNDGAGTPNFVVVDGGVTQANLTGAGEAAGVVYRMAAAYAANDFAMSQNGGAVAIDASGTLPTVNLLEVGCLGSGNQCGGPIASLRYYPRRLINAELVAITTP